MSFRLGRFGAECRRGRSSAGLRLALVAALLPVGGCLVDDPPAYRAPQQTAPHINALRVLPRLDSIITYSYFSNEGIAFSIPISSEDVGEPIQARLFTDFVTTQSDVRLFERLPPSTLDEGDRVASYVWSPPRATPPGCHRVIVRVSHESNWRASSELYDPTDVDEVAWFARLFVDAPGVTNLADCPFPSDSP